MKRRNEAGAHASARPLPVGGRRAELDAMIAEVVRQLDVFEDEADEARVPMQWRD